MTDFIEYVLEWFHNTHNSLVGLLYDRVAWWHDCEIGFSISSDANVQLRKLSFSTSAQLCNARAAHVDYWAEMGKSVQLKLCNPIIICSRVCKACALAKFRYGPDVTTTRKCANLGKKYLFKFVQNYFYSIFMVIHCHLHHGSLGLRCILVKVLGKKYLTHGHISGSKFHIRSDEARCGIDLFIDTADEIDRHPSNPLSKWMQNIIG